MEEHWYFNATAKRVTHWWVAGGLGSIALIVGLASLNASDEYFLLLPAWLALVFLTRELLLITEYRRYKTWYLNWSKDVRDSHPLPVTYKNYRADYFFLGALDTGEKNPGHPEDDFRRLVKIHGPRLDQVEFDNRELTAADRLTLGMFREVGYGSPRPLPGWNIDFDLFEKDTADSRAEAEEVLEVRSTAHSDYGISKDRYWEVKSRQLYENREKELSVFSTPFRTFAATVAFGLIFGLGLSGCLVPVFIVLGLHPEIAATAGIALSCLLAGGWFFGGHLANKRSQRDFLERSGDLPTDEELKAVADFDLAQRERERARDVLNRYS